MTYSGVNLGGWLVLERWITPSLFAGSDAKDEYTFLQEGGEATRQKIQRHRKDFIAAEDLEWLKTKGINALRVPVPHWIFGGYDVYMEGVEHLDWLMDEARKRDMQILLELHTAPGSQNGHDHSGKKGGVGWHRSPVLIDVALDVIELLAARYKTYNNLLGIGLLNEPSNKIDPNLLKFYYAEGYKRVRRHCDDAVAVVINDQFNPLDWRDALTEPEYTNVWLDTHLYQAFSWADKHKSRTEVLQKASREWGDIISKVQSSRPLMVGEWSLGIDSAVLSGLKMVEKEEFLLQFYETQKTTFSKTAAQFFWTYKTEDMLGWSYKGLFEKGVLGAARIH